MQFVNILKIGQVVNQNDSLRLVDIYKDRFVAPPSAELENGGKLRKH